MAFVWVSDSPKWGRLNVEDANKDLFFASKRGQGDVAKEELGRDLAILTACNHTIMSRGSFSLWAGLLAGGRVLGEAGFVGENFGRREEL